MVGILLVFIKTNLKRKFKKLNIFVFCIFAGINFEKVDDYFDFFFPKSPSSIFFSSHNSFREDHIREYP